MREEHETVYGPVYVTQVQYHRNGVGGEPYYTIYFEAREDSRETAEDYESVEEFEKYNPLLSFVAVCVPEYADEDEYQTRPRVDEQCYVLNLTDPTQVMSGSDWMGQTATEILRARVAAAEEP